MGFMRGTFRLVALSLLGAVSLAGCAKNVDRVDFSKWGNSYVPAASDAFKNVDTTAQGGVPNGTQPNSPNYVVPKASVGGAYHRTFATSPSYRMVGGFHR
jgi:hypothetical protein